MILERSVSFEVRSDNSETEGDGLSLTGHAAVFNQETEIDSWEGRFLETIAPGAFKKTIRERTPVLQFDHGRHPLIGSIPIGTINTLREDDEGLYVEARLTDNWLIQPVRDAIRDKSINGMSFRFEVVREEWRDAQGKIVKGDELLSLLYGFDNPDDNDQLPLTRTLKELKVAELGPVVFPAYAGTSVDVRAKGMAEVLVREQKFVYELRSALALDSKSPLEKIPTLTQEPELKREIAKALLFRDAPVVSHPSVKDAARSIPVSETVLEDDHVSNFLRNEDEPTSDSHPSENEKEVETNTGDAPTSDSHPSQSLDDSAEPELRTRLLFAIRSMNRRIDSAEFWDEESDC